MLKALDFWCSIAVCPYRGVPTPETSGEGVLSYLLINRKVTSAEPFDEIEFHFLIGLLMVWEACQQSFVKTDFDCSFGAGTVESIFMLPSSYTIRL